MSSTENDSKYLRCVRYTDVRFGHMYYINYVSEPSEKRSLKLPEAMLRLSLDAGTEASSSKENAQLIANMNLEESILRYLIARHGEGMPAMYLTEDGKELVLDFHIFEEQAGAFKKLPLCEKKSTIVGDVRRQFLSSVIMVLILRIDYVLGRKSIDGWTQRPTFKIEVLEDRVKMAPGKRATIERISKVARVVPKANETAEQADDELRKELISTWPIKAGDRLFSFGWSDELMQRTTFFNIRASDHPNSLTLPALLVKIARSTTRKEAHAMAQNLTMEDQRDITTHIFFSLFKYHEHDEPQVFESAENSKHLVFDVPFSLKQAPMLIKCFPGQESIANFYSAIKCAYWDYYEDKLGQPRDIERALAHHRIRVGEPIATARKATKKHIKSVLFRKMVPLSADELRYKESIMQSMMQNSHFMASLDEMMKHMKTS